MDNDGKLVLFENLTTNGTAATPYAINAKANTLQVTTRTGAYGTSKGFSVAPNAKVWLFQDDWANVSGSYKRMNTKIDCGEGQTGLNKAITELNLYDYQNANADVPFNGYISAVFEGGMAATVVIYEVNAGLIDQGNTNVKPNGQVLDDMSTVAQVNEALKKGDVVIEDTWTPTPVAGETRLVEIPHNTTLTINGNFDAVRQNVRIHLERGATKGTLDVKGQFITSAETTSIVNYDIKADSMQIIRNGARVDAYVAGQAQRDGVKIDGTVTVERDLTIQDAIDEPYTTYGHEVVVRRGGTLIVKGDVDTMKYDNEHAAAGTDCVCVWVDGHMEVNGSMVPQAVVTYINSLIVRNTMSGKLILNGGKAVIGTLSGELKMQSATDQLIINTAITGAITQVKAGGTITIKAGAIADSSAETSLPNAPQTATSSDTVFTVAADKGSATETTPQVVPVEAKPTEVTDDPAATIQIGSAPEGIVTMTKNGTNITVSADLNTVKTKITEWLTTEGNTFNPNSPSPINGFGISPSGTGKNRVCVSITWKPAARGEGKTVSQCDVYKLVNGTETLIATSDSTNTEKYDSDTKVTGSIFWPHLGVIKGTTVGETTTYAYDGTDVSSPATYVIKWTYNDGVVVTQTRTVDFTLTPVTPAP